MELRRVNTSIYSHSVNCKSIHVRGRPWSCLHCVHEDISIRWSYKLLSLSSFNDTQDNLTAFQKVSTMYIKYVLAFRKLEECYDQIVHPQKRRLIRHMLDGTIGRYMCVCVCVSTRHSRVGFMSIYSSRQGKYYQLVIFFYGCILSRAYVYYTHCI